MHARRKVGEARYEDGGLTMRCERVDQTDEVRLTVIILTWDEDRGEAMAMRNDGGG